MEKTGNYGRNLGRSYICIYLMIFAAKNVGY